MQIHLYLRGEDMIKGAMLLAVLAGATGCSINAIPAIENDRRPSQVVYFDDLDIADNADARILYQRIRTAAVEVCGSVPANDVAQLWARPCIQRAIASAISDINERRRTTHRPRVVRTSIPD